MSLSDASVSPDVALLEQAASGSPDALAEASRLFAPSVARIRLEGMQAYGDLGIDDDALTLGVARIITQVAAAERSSAPNAQVTVPDILEVLVLRDVYLAEGLLLGSETAWAAFEGELEGAFRSVRSHFSGQTPQVLLDEIRDSVLGTFFVDGKVRTYRATAPIGAWARQVVFNLFRQRINLRKSGKEATALSQMTDEESRGGEDSLLPPSGAPSPPEVLHRIELSQALRHAVPKALATLDRDEQRMLDVLPIKRMTQVDLARELGVSPFKLNRWYKEVRARFLRGVTRHVREVIGLDDEEARRLIDHLAAVWARSGPVPEEPRKDGGEDHISTPQIDLAQSDPPG